MWPSYMKIQIATDHAIRILEYLYENKGQLHTASTISKAIGITCPSFAKIAGVLRAHGLIKTEQGRNGGYKLGKPAYEISIYDVFLAIEGDMQISHCFDKDDEPCTKGEKEHCGLRRFLYNLQEDVIIATMSKMRISDLAHSDEDKVASDTDLQKQQSRFSAIA